MKRIFLIIFTAAIAVSLNSCDKPTKKQKQADALFQQITKVYTLKPDGSMNYQYQHELDIHSHYAFNSLYGETFIVYNPQHQSLDVKRSETRTAEGEMVASPENAYNEVLPRFASGAPPYHHLREMVVTHTGLEKNSTIFMNYSLKTDAGYKPFLMGNEVLSESSPVRELVIKVRFPKDKELNYQLLHAEENLNISQDGDMKVYKWVFEDVPATSKEEHQPRHDTHRPRLIFSTASFDRAASYMMEQVDYELPASVESGLKDLMKNKTSRMDSIMAVQDMVVNHINHFDIPARYKGFKFHSNNQVLENNGGTTFEKTVLLTSLLKHLGIQAHPVAIEPGPFHQKETGNLNNFVEYYVQVNANDQKLYLSAIEDHSFNGLYRHGEQVNLVIHKEAGETKVVKPETPTSQQHLEASFEMEDARHIEGEIDATLSHCENPYLSIQRDEGTIKSMLSPGFPASAVSDFTLKQSTPSQTSVSFSIDQNLSPDQQNGYRFISIPHTQTGLDQWHMEVLPGNRKAPLQVGWPLDIRYQYSVDLPESVELINEQTQIEKDTDIGQLRIHIEPGNGNVSIDRHLQIDQTIISPDSYKAFREMISLWRKDQYRTLTFKKVEK